MTPTAFVSLTPSDVIAISAVIVAVAAMLATFWQGYVARVHSRLSVRPHLDWVIGSQTSSPVFVEVVNNGLGPAIVESFTIQIDSASFECVNLDLPALLRNEFLRHPFQTSWTVLTPATPLAAGQRVKLLEAHPQGNNVSQCQEALALLRRFQFHIRYASFYGEHFELHIDSAAPGA